jgi:hypothetical protein
MKLFFPILLFLLFSFAFATGVKAELNASSTKDLALSSLLISPSAPIIGQECRIVARVTNNGSASLTNLGSEEHDFTDFELTDTEIPRLSLANPLLPSAYIEYIYTGYFTASGTKTLVVEADQADFYDEKNEENNIRTISVTVLTALATDLVVPRISLDVEKPILNQKVNITVEVKNQGRNILTGNEGFMVEDSGTLPSIKRDIAYSFENFTVSNVFPDPYPSLDQPLNGVYKVRFEGRFTDAGAKTLSYAVNTNRRLIESNHDNNSATTSIQVYESESDRDAFSISNIKVESISSSSAKLSWSTSEAKATTLYYRQSTTLTFSTKTSSSKIDHSLTLSGLQPGGRYYYQIMAEINEEEKFTELAEFFQPTKDLPVLSATTTPPIKDPVPPATEPEKKPVSESGNIGYQVESLSVTSLVIKDANLYARLKGRIILRVEKDGEAYWVNPSKQEMYYLGRPADAFAIMRQKGVGITEADLAKLPVSLPANPNGSDTDSDGLSDLLEDALGTDKAKKDSDGDKHDDRTELQSGYDPKKGGGVRLPIDQRFALAQAGRIFLATERNGEAWYISPADQKRYFLGRPLDAFNVMRAVGMGIAEKDFNKL